MNTLPQNLMTDAANAEAIHMDLVRDIPRRVIGFTVEIESGLDTAQMRASLDQLAMTSAFELTGIRETDAAPVAAGRMIHAEFSLIAERGTTGDPQIFALLREIAGRHRWNTMEKMLAR